MPDAHPIFALVYTGVAAVRRSAPTFREYADRWLETWRTLGRELRPTTRHQYRMML